MTLHEQLNLRIECQLATAARKAVEERRGKRPAVWDASAAIRAAIMPLRYGQLSPHLPAVIDLLGSFLDRTDERIGIVDAVTNSIGPGWSTLVEGRYVDEVSNAGVLLLPMAQLALWCRRNPHFCDHPDRVEAIIEAAARLCRHYLAGIEWENGHAFMRSRIDGRVEPYNHVSPYAAACAIIGHLTGEDVLLSTAYSFLRTFEAHTFVEQETGTIWWSYRPPLDGEPVARGEQVWKAITTLHLPLALQDIDQSITIEPYIRLFREHIYCGRNQHGPKFQIHIGNAKRRWLLRDKIKTEARRNRVQTIAEWAILGDPEIDQIISSAVEKRVDLFPDGWFGISRATIGLASILARSTWETARMK